VWQTGRIQRFIIWWSKAFIRRIGRVVVKQHWVTPIDIRRNALRLLRPTALAERSGRLLTDNIDLLRRAVSNVKRDHPFELIAMVVLPEHLHCVWALPPGDADYPLRWKKIKAAFSRGLPHGERRSASKGERGIWQRRYWEHTLRNDDDLRRHVDYIHYNPVKHARPGGHVLIFDILTTQR